jgi:hypothetical protein
MMQPKSALIFDSQRRLWERFDHTIGQLLKHCRGFESLSRAL